MTVKEFNDYLKRFKEKDYKSVEPFYKEIKKIIFITAYRYTHNITSVEDITSEVILKILTYSGEEIRNPKGWLIEVTRNAVLNFKEKTKKEVFIEYEIAASAEEKSCIFLNDIEELLTEKEYQTILNIVYYDYTLKETAEILQVSKRQAQRYYTQAKNKIKAFYKETNDKFE